MELTIKKVKDCIGFEPGSSLYNTLSQMCDIWYKLALQSGLTEEQAANDALKKLGDRLLSLSKK